MIHTGDDPLDLFHRRRPRVDVVGDHGAEAHHRNPVNHLKHMVNVVTGPAPIAEKGVTLIRELYAIEAVIKGTDAATRLVARQERSTPILARLDDWLRHHRARASAKSPLGEALAYIAKYREGLGRFLTDGMIELDSNTVERTIRPIALNRKNALFAGHQAGAENWAVIASLIETCKMNAIDPHAWLASTLTAIISGHKQKQIDDLLPWNYAAKV